MSKTGFGFPILRALELIIHFFERQREQEAALRGMQTLFFVSPSYDLRSCDLYSQKDIRSTILNETKAGRHSTKVK